MFQETLKEFVDYASNLKGDEKGEAQLFCDRFFRAFGHGGLIEANGTLEARIKFQSGKTKFADCLWSPPDRPGVLIEMKKKLETNLEKHFPQARNYWIEMNPEVVIGSGAQKPEYIILCNFDKFIIYRQLSLVDEVKLSDLLDRSSAFNFMLPVNKEPIFKNNVEAISQEVARTIGELFKYLIFDKKESRESAQHFLLQCVLSLFSEDFGLIPNNFFSELIRDCQNGESTYDLFGALFKQMASETPAKAGKFKNIPYFNGGLFEKIEPLELDKYSLDLLQKAAGYNWKSVNPSIFGALFEGTMNADERHAFGAHFTSEADILKIVNPTIIKPWKKKIEKAQTLTELVRLQDELSKFKVLDPACGCGNFLFVAYKALKDIEMQIIEKIAENFTTRSTDQLDLGLSKISTKQMFGIDIQAIAVEVAKMTLMLAKETASDEWNKRIGPLLSTLGLSYDQGLPLDSLDENIFCRDALLEGWPEFDVVIGNPPYQSKNKMKQEMDHVYISKIREKYPDIPGRADFCVYWFRKAHELMKKGQRAGLVGTNTIRQNYSRIGGLDYIIDNDGTITDAISTQVWSGDAAVHVSIVNWIKDEDKNEKLLVFQKGDNLDSPFEYYHPDNINSSLSLSIDLTSAMALAINKKSERCYQGQTHGHEGFLIEKDEAEKLLIKNPKFKDVCFPYLTGDEMIGKKDSKPTRYVIDFRKHDIFSATKYAEVFNIIKEIVYPDKEKKAKDEEEKNNKTLEANPKAKVNHHHKNFFKQWWKLSYARNEMMEKIEKIKRYIVCAQVTKRPIFEFVSKSINPNAALIVFPMEDDYSFGILQSGIHWEWFKARCSTLKGDWRYTSDTVFDSFSWPQEPDEKTIDEIAKYSKELRDLRRKIMKENDFSLRDLYRLMENTPNNPVSDVQNKLDKAVRSAYGMKPKDDILEFLLRLNNDLFDKEQNGIEIQAPGFPKKFADKISKYVSDDCVTV